MAQQVNVKFVDDLDGSDAAGTVSFTIDGRAYEIDLSADNAARTTVQVSRSVTGLSLSVMACRQGMATSSYLLSGRRCLSGVSDGLESCAVVVPSGSGLVESSA
jgi:Lsr2